MNHISPFYTSKNDSRRNVVIFLSGRGTNALRILEHWQGNEPSVFHQVILFTDRPEKSKARSIASQFNLELIESDIHHFYRQRGSSKITLATPQGRQIREEWTELVRSQLKPYPIDFGLFAGFIPLTNITADFPCLNVHPGDLTYQKDGHRYLIGLHTIPIERAILDGLTYLRSSVIVAQPYGDSESNMDSGPLLGISEKVDIDFLGYTLEQLRSTAESRPANRPASGYQDDLEDVAKFNQDKLKREGDWIVFPRVVQEFSRGNFGLDEKGVLCYNNGNEWLRIRTVILGKTGKKLVPHK